MITGMISKISNPLRAGLCLLLATSLLLLPGEADAKRKKKKKRIPKHRIAMFLVNVDDADQDLIDAALKGFIELAGHVEQLDVVQGQRLRKSIKKDPVKAIGKCGADVRCIVKLAKRVKAKEIVYARVKNDSGGLLFQVLAIGTRNKKIKRKTSFAIASHSDLATALPENFSELFGFPLPPDATLESTGTVVAAVPSAVDTPPELGAEAGGAETGDGEAAAGEVPGTGDPAVGALADASATAATGEQTVAGESVATPGDVMATEPAATTEITASSTEGGATAGEATAEGTDGSIALAEPPTVEQAPARGDGGSPLLFWGGVGTAAVGAGLFALGGYYGSQVGTLKESVKYGSGGTSQLEAEQISQDAADAADRANLLMGAGGGVMVAGAVMILVDFVFQDEAPKTSVHVGEDGVSASLSWSW